MIREYSKRVKRLIREYASRAYEAELGQELAKLEQEFVNWRSGKLSAGELSDRIYSFSRGPARDLWSRYNARIEDMQVGYAIFSGLLPRDELPDELLEALEPIIAFYDQHHAVPEQDAR